LQPVYSISINNFKNLGINLLSFELAIKNHIRSLKLPSFEKFELGSQIRRSSKNIKDHIVEAYGRWEYKADIVKFLISAQSSWEVCHSQLEAITHIYPELDEWKGIQVDCDLPGKKISCVIHHVELIWKSKK
jgi:four helix bundle protein